MRSFVVKPGASASSPHPKRTGVGPRTPQRRHDLTLLFHEELKAAGYSKSDSWTLAQSLASLDATDSELETALEEAKRKLSAPAKPQPTTAFATPSIASKVALIVRDLEHAHGVQLRITTTAYDPRTKTATINLEHDIGSQPTG